MFGKMTADTMYLIDGKIVCYSLGEAMVSANGNLDAIEVADSADTATMPGAVITDIAFSSMDTAITDMCRMNTEGKFRIDEYLPPDGIEWSIWRDGVLLSTQRNFTFNQMIHFLLTRGRETNRHKNGCVRGISRYWYERYYAPDGNYNEAYIFEKPGTAIWMVTQETETQEFSTSTTRKEG